VKRRRTTHSDLATLLEQLAGKLSAIPAGYCVSDASTMRLLTDAARIICEQDERIGELTTALREHGGKAARPYLSK
jgi:hypothetical protein